MDDHIRPTSQHTDARLPAGHTEEFKEFYRCGTRELVAFLVLQGATLALAADLVQDTMITLYRRWPEVEHPRAWAYRTASRALIRALSTVRETPTADPLEHSPLLRVTNVE